MLSSLLLAWYDQHKRTLPFRGTRDAYRVWVSEIMLQQTRTETVVAYYERFLQRFPDVFALADAPEQEVLKRWEGLGYYSRARNLHKAAQEIVSRYHGVFPADWSALRALPGVGDYTASAVASIAFDLPCPAMDGNLTRVLSRFHGVREDVGIPSVKRRLAALAQEDMPAVRCGDFNQALMDLGATVCVPGTPDCARCPLSPLCDAYRVGDAEELPIKAAQKPPKEVRLAVALVTCHGRILMRQRQETLLRGLWVYPLIENAAQPDEIEKVLKSLGVNAEFRAELGPARHVFTHRVWLMTVFHFEADSAPADGFFSLPEMLSLPMPTAMRAAREHAIRLLTPRIVPADDGNLPQTAQAYAESWQSAHAAHCTKEFLARHTPERMEAVLRQHRNSGRAVYSLQFGDRVEGVMVLDHQENELVSLYIRPEAQRVGMGSAAVAFAVAALDSARDMQVTCLCGNAAALALYRRFGFDTVASVRVLDAAQNLQEEVLLRKAEQPKPEGNA